MAIDQWTVFEYEVNQWRAMLGLLSEGHPILSVVSQEIRNAIVESALIHTRVLTQILLSEGFPDDIKLVGLLPSFSSPHVARLKTAYGQNADTSSPQATINKRLALPSNVRTGSHDYSRMLTTLVPIIHELVEEIRQHRPVSQTE